MCASSSPVITNTGNTLFNSANAAPPTTSNQIIGRTLGNIFQIADSALHPRGLLQCLMRNSKASRSTLSLWETVKSLGNRELSSVHALMALGNFLVEVLISASRRRFPSE